MDVCSACGEPVPISDAIYRSHRCGHAAVLYIGCTGKEIRLWRDSSLIDPSAWALRCQPKSPASTAHESTLGKRTCQSSAGRSSQAHGVTHTQLLRQFCEHITSWLQQASPRQKVCQIWGGMHCFVCTFRAAGNASTGAWLWWYERRPQNMHINGHV